MSNLSLAAFAYIALPWTIAFFFYLEAGRRTWQSLFLTLPERSREPLAQMVKSNSVPAWGMLLWSIFWGPIMIVAWLMGRLMAVRQGRPSTFDLQ